MLPGRQVRVHVDGGLTTRRTYSLRHYDPAGSLDLCVYGPGDGPGAAWGRSVRVGDEVRFGKPEGGFVLRPGAGRRVRAGLRCSPVRVCSRSRARAGVAGSVPRALPPVQESSWHRPSPRRAPLPRRSRLPGPAPVPVRVPGT
ncbi:siderophore-interacting protein [Streptomyces sp. A1277]|uniref:siderophore-interacting protein n=1 Tax=Streptomyces sp. A1277 TaxID=2563103 RepID=UPI003211D85C